MLSAILGEVLNMPSIALYEPKIKNRKPFVEQCVPTQYLVAGTSEATSSFLFSNHKMTGSLGMLEKMSLSFNKYGIRTLPPNRKADKEIEIVEQRKYQYSLQ